PSARDLPHSLNPAGRAAHLFVRLWNPTGARAGAILSLIQDGEMSLSAVIVDDEQLARDELVYLLQSIGEVDVLAQGKNGVEGVNLIKEHMPDLVFLDVQMPGLDGFGVIKKLLDRKVAMPQV